MGRRRKRNTHIKGSMGIGFFMKTIHAYIVGAFSIYTQYYILSYIETRNSLESLGNAFGELFVLLTPAGTGVESFLFYTFLAIIIGYILLVVAWDSLKYTFTPQEPPMSE